MAKGVDVIHVYPMRKESAESKKAHHAEKGYLGGFIDDREALFARNLDVSKTPTAILTDAKGVILYRGRIDDSDSAKNVQVRDLANAIDEHLAGKPVTVEETEPFG
jgi:hypothetical protein